METELIPIEKDQTFHFSCSPQQSCYTECCRNLNQFLTPYDVIRLKTRLAITAEDFFRRYATLQIGPDTGLPVAILNATAERRCPFISPEGCSVYADRPSSCRTYPLIRLISRSRNNGQLTERYFLLQEDHCRGFETETAVTLAEWIEDQDISIYNQMNDLMLDLISLKNRYGRPVLDQSLKTLFQQACYNAEAFREMLFVTRSAPDAVHVEAELLEQARHDDLALLKVGIETMKAAFLRNTAQH